MHVEARVILSVKKGSKKQYIFPSHTWGADKRNIKVFERKVKNKVFTQYFTPSLLFHKIGDKYQKPQDIAENMIFGINYMSHMKC